MYWASSPFKLTINNSMLFNETAYSYELITVNNYLSVYVQLFIIISSIQRIIRLHVL